MKKAPKFFVFAVLILMLGVSFFMKNFYTPNTILKTAIKENTLTVNNYILCKRERVTGFDWRLVKNEKGEKTNEYCNIAGSNPFDELNLRYEFLMADNTFVFYVEEKKMSYSETINEDAIEYVVSGWDILYPVKHNDLFFFDLLNTKKYITKDDLWKKTH